MAQGLAGIYDGREVGFGRVSSVEVHDYRLLIMQCEMVYQRAGAILPSKRRLA